LGILDQDHGVYLAGRSILPDLPTIKFPLFHPGYRR
jgi:hypothetical protein